LEYRRNKLLYVIEKLRQQLNELAKNKYLTDPEVVRLSQRLDRLLNKYSGKQG
jgi:hypothetical protein